MVSVDEHTQVAMEVVAQSLKISEQTLLRLLEALSKLLEGKEQQPKDFIFDDKTKVGKQKISDLMKKHEKNGGIVALDENLTKQQLNDYQKELKKLGVDFSVVRNGKEDYSFFFSAAQANVIEKALKNIVERKSAVLEKEEVKTAEKDLKEVRQELTPDQAEKVKAIYDEITTAKKKEPKENNINYDRLSKQEKLLYEKLEELDEVKRGLYSQEVNRVEKLFENRYKQDIDVNKKNTIEKETLPEKPLEKVRTKVAELDEKEQNLLGQKVGVVAGEVNESEYNELKKDFSPEQIEKIENIFDDLLKEVKNEFIKENTVEKETLHEKPLEKVKKIVSEEIEKKPLDKVKEIASNLDEKEHNLLVQKSRLVAGKISENKYNEIKKDLSPEQIEKIEKIASENIASEIKPGAIVDGKINATVFADLLKKVENESIKGKTKVITNAKDEKEQVKNMLNSLSNDEQKLMLQYTKVMSEGLSNHYAEKSSYKESDKFDEMLKDFTPEQIEKITAVVNQNIYADINSTEKQNGKIHANNFQSILTDVKKEMAKETNKDASKQKKVEFSMNGIKEIDAKIKKEEKEVSQDKNKKQSISR
ncbi:hypothetical protein P4V88_15820 [Bacillus thuringiensis]|uniref:hypothetical protein n=2 Tax=Bacillus thuringiensis TaxID=1428 RepID=UPI000A37BA91|nr:hypothetical protein [Bacillus thuringiensis]MED2124692.1 hypothetical protein [Bacillus thuringiensis]MED2147192.1 hypothetical protein [Bacillus thuringiensis]MED2173441.1 hypothetical protein [Bacillus thuringiensis]MED3504469.1 hypothetical protein [Bacillus thuringiensis]MRA57460.1 hypothetical protein [Bacillus thuringiensis]